MEVVRYYSRGGSTKLIAEAIAEELKVKAISVDQSDAQLTEEVDVLFLGGALYAYGLDKHLKKYISTLNGRLVKKAVVFSTSWFSKHALTIMKNMLKEKGIDVSEEYIYHKGKPSVEALNLAKEVAKKYANNWWDYRFIL